MASLTANRPNGAFNDAISTSSSTLVNPDVEEDARRKASPRSSGNSRNTIMKYNGTGAKRPTFKTKISQQGKRISQSPGRAPNRRKTEYPDDHRCSDQDLGSGLCDCTRDGSNDSSSSTSIADEYTGNRRLAKASLPDEAVNGLETYDMKMMAARRRKLLFESNHRPSPTASSSRKDADSSVETAETMPSLPPKSYSRDLQSDPVLAPRRIGKDRFTPRAEAGSSSENDTYVGKVDRLWASSPGLPKHSSKFDNAPAITANEVEHGYSSDENMRVPPMNRSYSEEKVRMKTSPSTFAPRKSIDTFYQKLFQEERQRQEELRLKKEAARERRRQELKKRQSQWPEISLQRNDIEDGSRSVAHEQEKQWSDDKSHLDEKAIKDVTQDEESLESSRIAPKPSPIKPTAGAYKARLLALRSSSTSSPNRSSELIKANPFSTLTRSKRIASTELEDDITPGLDYLGHGPFQSTPPRSGNTSRSSLKEKMASPKAAGLETPISDSGKSIRETLKKLNLTIQEALQIKANPELQELHVNAPDLKIEEAHKRDIVDLADESKRMEDIVQLDQIYEEKLQDVRNRIDELSKNRPLIKRCSTSSSILIKGVNFLIKSCFMLLTLFILMYAAEARARYIYLTIYHDQFQPVSFFSLSPISIKTLLQSLWIDWIQFESSTAPMIIVNGNITSSHLETDSGLISIIRSVATGQNWTIGVQQFLKKALPYFKYDLYDSQYTCTFSPT